MNFESIGLDVVFIFYVCIMIPFMIYEPYLLLRNRKLMKQTPHSIVKNRELLVAITTKGTATTVVNSIIDEMKLYKVQAKYVVVVEEEDGNGYHADEKVIVPSNYTTPKHSLFKPRALNYFSQWLKEKGYGSETYVIHLDDDSIVPEKYLKFVLGMKEEAGQGVLRLRNGGKSLFSTLADFGRVTSCDMYCAHYNSIGRPLGVHGEGLVIRADVESQIGWDFIGNTLNSEDFLMGQTIVSEGYKFGFIPAGIFISPPVNIKDFYKQRRRWMYSFEQSRKLAKKLNKGATNFFTFQYEMGWTVGIGAFIWLLTLLYHIHIFTPFIYLFTTGLVISFTEMQYGAWKTTKLLRWNIVMFFLQIPVMIFLSGTFFYEKLVKPKTYDIIKKVI